MTLLAADAKVPGTIAGTGGTLIIDHTTDNTLVTFRFKHKDVKMLAAEEPFEAGGRKFTAGAFIVPDADRATLEPSIKELGLCRRRRRVRAVGQDARPRRAAHRLRPRVAAHAG